MSSRLVPLGNFFFRHRNWAFPALVGGFFALAIPPADLFGSEALEHVKDGLAILIALAGLTIRALVIGRDHVRRAGQRRGVHAARLYTEGMFSLCRNPLYVGNVLIFLGIFLMHGNRWTLLLGWPSYVFIYCAIVAAEEDYLTRTFGVEYENYCAAVPRWLPNLSQFKNATWLQPFNVRRVILVEYPNIGVTVIALTLAEFYEEIEEPFSSGSTARLSMLGAIMAAAVLWIALVRFAKKRRLLVAV